METLTIGEVAKKVEAEIQNPLLIKKTEEQIINDFLDKINDIKKILSKKTEILNKISVLLTEITWLNINSDQDELIVKNIIKKTKELHRFIIREYASINTDLHKTSIFKSDLKKFKNAIDDIKEDYEDLEFIFFDLRTDEEFNQLIDSIQ